MGKNQSSVNKISLVTPMYNEEARVEGAMYGLKAQLSKIGLPFEIILINDGSTDRSFEIAKTLSVRIPELKVVGYKNNAGRGKAMRVGFSYATGDLVVTTESDSSWGEDIIIRLVDALMKNPEVDFVIASPHLKGGGYRNVPKYRVLISEIGNIILRLTFFGKTTMATGMTRCYRKKILDTVLLESNQKEIHLEILSKLLSLGYTFIEIPAVLSWKKDSKGNKRKSNFKIIKLVWSHLLFSFNEKPAIFIGSTGLISLILGVIAIFINIYGHILYEYSEKLIPFEAFPSATLITLLLLLGFQLILFTFLATQNRKNYSELIKVQSLLLQQVTVNPDDSTVGDMKNEKAK
jgi:dolichol-phosphate mannosyltransferase